MIENQLQDYGSLMEIVEVTKTEENGEMDIKTKGSRVFRILEVIKEVPDKLYSGAIVNYPETNEEGNRDLMRRVMNSIKELHKLLKVEKKFQQTEDEVKAYDVAHHVGLSLEEEYEMLHLLQERQRQEYLKRHLTKVIPLVAEMEQLKEKIKLNGHFKNLSGLGFES
jgi:Lon protease-like protein